MITKRSRYQRILLAGVAMLVYAGAFLPLYRLLGPGVAALVTAPVVLSGWHGGSRHGTLAGVIGVLINIALLRVANEADWYTTVRASVSGGLVVVAIGAGVGKLHELLLQVRRQAHALAHEREHLTAHLQERHHAQTALKREHDFITAVLNTIGSLVIVLDCDGRIVRFNRACERTTGYRFAEVEGRYVWDLFVLPDELHAVKAVFAQLHIEKAPNTYENSWVTRDNQQRRIAWSNTILCDAAGQPEYVIGTGIDITEQRQMQAAVRASEAKLRAIVDHTTDAIYIKDLDGRYVLLNPAAEQTFGKSDGDTIGCTDRELFGAAMGNELRATDRHVMERGTPYTFEHSRLIDGVERVWLTTKFPYKSPQGTVIGVIGVGREITERTQAERALRAAEARYRDLVEHASDIIYTHDLHGTITAVNVTTERLTGYTCEDLVGRNIIHCIAPQDLPRVQQELLRNPNGAAPSTPYELEIIRKDGSRLPVEVNTRLLMQDGRAVGVEGIARDITERKQAEAQLRQHAFYDALTGLPNRALFMDRLTHALAYAERHNTTVALLFLDLDNLKVVNDSLGHHVGDQMLVITAERLQACLRLQDTAARLGGDEFTVVFDTPDDIDAVLTVAQRLQAQLRLPMQIDAHELVVTASIGVALSGPSLTSPVALLGAADLAMYQAKANGKGRSVVFEPWMSSKAHERLALETDLRRAIAHDELCVQYQPIIDLQSGRVIAAEALVRWEHPQHGRVAPAAFIPLAEETGLIIPLGNWVLAQVCQQLRAWQLRHPHADTLRVAVNLSARQFQHPTLATDIARLLHTTEVDPACLELEITESVVMQDATTTIETLRQLKALGVQLALDDFGTGYSSLAYLRRFPIDVLKIDRSFVQRLGCDLQDTEIIRAIITLAHTLNLAVTGEGIETAEQRAQLCALGCDHGQGYLFAHPMSGQEFGAWFTCWAKQTHYRKALCSLRRKLPSPDDMLHAAP